MSVNEQLEAEIEEIFEYYSRKGQELDQEAMVSMLRELQDLMGFISPAFMERAAKAGKVKLSTVQAIIKRYPSLKAADTVHEIVICTGKSCAAKGNLEVLTQLKKKLNINENGISEDGRICLKTRTCLKKCRMAPNVLIDGVCYVGKSVKEILELLSDGSRYV